MVGNAEVESGFSVNKQLLQENLLERSIVAPRLVIQAIHCQNGFLNICIDKKMLTAVRCATLATNLRSLQCRK